MLRFWSRFCLLVSCAAIVFSLADYPQAGAQVVNDRKFICNSLTALPVRGPAPLSVQLTTKSNLEGFSPELNSHGYNYKFGDGTQKESTGNVTMHTYQKPGKYTASVFINVGNASETTRQCQTTIEVIAPKTKTPAAAPANPSPPAPPNSPSPAATPPAAASAQSLSNTGPGTNAIILGLLAAAASYFLKLRQLEKR